MNDIIAKLKCPKCNGDISQKGQKLLCKTDEGHTYRIKRGIHLFTTGDEDKGFDQRWIQHPKPQATVESIFWDKTGWKPEDFNGKTVLDAGCGVGRFVQVAHTHGAKVLAADSSPAALKACGENCPEAHLIATDLTNLAIKDESVDMAYSIGVLHHTSDPSKAFAEVARTVKPGGQLAIWVYCQPVANELLLVLNMFHEITRSVPPEQLHDIFQRYAVQIRDYYQQLGKEAMLAAGKTSDEIANAPPAWGPLQQIVRVSNSKDDEECISDTFDWACPTYRSWHTEDEVQKWFEKAGFNISRVGSFPVSISGVKKE